MRLMKLPLIVVLALWSITSSAGEPSLTAKRVSEDVFEMELVTDQTADVAVAQRALLPAAQQLCGGKAPRLGHYKFESAEPLPRQPPAPPKITLRQRVHCETGSTQAPQTQAAALTPHDDRAIENLTMKYLAARDSGNYDEAYASFSPSMRNSTSIVSWSNNARSFNAKAGKVTKRRIKKITWYDNPASASAPGTYAAADYESESENAAVYCGYVAWHGTPEGSIQIVREEQSFIDRDSAKKMPPENLKAFAQRFGCEVR